MSQLLSFELPEPVADLVDSAAFSQYTLGEKSEQLAERLGQLSLDDLFPGGIRDDDLAQCALSGIWLLHNFLCLLYTSPSPRDATLSRMPSSA